MKRLNLAVMSCLCLFLVACAQVPEAPLRGYADAFGAAKDAGDQLYRTLDANISEAAAVNGAADAPPVCAPDGNVTPTCFDPASFLPPEQRPLRPEIEARLIVFETVGAYNEALIALASGATGEALGRRLDRLTGVLNKAARLGGVSGLAGLAPILAEPVLAAFKGLAQKLETARANVAARQSIAAEADTIRTAIDSLTNDTVKVYEVYLTSRGIIATRGGFPTDEEAKAENARNIQFYNALGAYVVLLFQVGQSQDALLAALTEGVSPADQLEAALDQALEIRAAGVDFRKAIEATSTP